MPILQYKCAFCGKEFEELVKNHAEEVHCPDCKKPACRLWSGKVYSSTGKNSCKCGGSCSSCDGCK